MPPLPSVSNVRNLTITELHNLLEPISRKPSTSISNWSRTFQCTPACIFDPETEYQCELILELAKRRKLPVRATGVGHSPSDIACTNGFLICTLKLNRLLEICVEKEYVVVQSGMTLDDLHVHLRAHGLAMSNMGSISDQTVAGVTTVATHGTGINFKVVPSQVMSMTILLADGRKVRCSRDEETELFLATLCGFGTTGLVLNTQLKVEREFFLEEVQEAITFPEALSRLEDEVNTAEHIRLWWFPTEDQVIVDTFKRVYLEPTTRLIIPGRLSSLRKLVIDHAIQLLLFLGLYFVTFVSWASILALRSWFPRDRSVKTDLSYRIFNLDCKFRQHTTEWAIPFEEASNCLKELHAQISEDKVSNGGFKPDFPIEVRFSDADDIYLSPCYKRKTCWIGIVRYTPYGYSSSYRETFEKFENIMVQHSGRPHWSKSHPFLPPDMDRMYPCFDDFLGILEKYDPTRVFQNEYVRRHIFGDDLGENPYYKK